MDPQTAETGRIVRAPRKQEKGRFSGFLFLTLQTALVSLYLEKKFRAFPGSPFNTFSYFLADVSRGQRSEAGGDRLGSRPAGWPREGKVLRGEKQLRAGVHGHAWVRRRQPSCARCGQVPAANSSITSSRPRSRCDGNHHHWRWAAAATGGLSRHGEMAEHGTCCSASCATLLGGASPWL